MTEHDLSAQEILKYKNQTIISSSVLLFLVATGLFVSIFVESDLLIGPLAGALLGVFLATLNAFALGYAYFALVIKKSHRFMVLWPITSFLVMCAAALVLALKYAGLLLGFALGLTAPLLFGAIIIFSFTKPA